MYTNLLRAQDTGHSTWDKGKHHPAVLAPVGDTYTLKDARRLLDLPHRCQAGFDISLFW